MIRALLIDRFKLTAHRETKTLPVYELIVAKGGIKFHPTGPDIPPGSHMRGTGRTGFNATGYFMDGLANYLEDRVERNIIDKTNLPGRYDFSLKWAYDNPADPDSGPSLFTALEEQLGLKLQPAKGPVEILVVDHVEMPSEN
jgi:bla regulator protein BlaR1